MTFTLTKYLENRSTFYLDFPFTDRNEFKGDHDFVLLNS